jgi:hypothetical protein
VIQKAGGRGDMSFKLIISFAILYALLCILAIGHFWVFGRAVEEIANRLDTIIDLLKRQSS